ncbi:N-acylglucosamine 2-epimerase [Prosthecobacter debontii]|uniref:N-acylglucosamine 2-epimerase n=1 Tax=Prosthecobacter debontii TaxID=48467 RepID=A0A1T4YAU6_9BACT|nr:AGE family epimerase/isomerase [Prosthecobacter debontii]SKA98431.1 N-acylglucosamine 2-epimerase [Prosthecobacter debontii]
MNPLTHAEGRRQLAAFYRDTLLHDVMPFWLKHGMDAEHDGIMTALDRDGSLLDTDKSIWFQGRAGWMFATLFNTLAPDRAFFDAAGSCLAFLEKHGYATDGKLFFTVTREGKPLRMRRYVYSEAFSAIANASYAKASGDERYADAARRDFAFYLRHSFEPGFMTPKVDSTTRPMVGIGALMIGIVTAQELRANLDHFEVGGRTATEWIDLFILDIQRLFFKPDLEVVMETVAPDGRLLDHLEGRLLNPGHAIECAWFILHEGRLRGEKGYIQLGLRMLDCMWKRGWDQEMGGLFYYRDVDDKPVQEYWHDMKFWWNHNETIIATLLAHEVTGDAKYAEMHRQVHDWSFKHFPDPEYGEWYGYLHRDGRVSQQAKGNMFKGPFHLPRMLWYCTQLLEEQDEKRG